MNTYCVVFDESTSVADTALFAGTQQNYSLTEPTVSSRNFYNTGTGCPQTTPLHRAPQNYLNKSNYG